MATGLVVEKVEKAQKSDKEVSSDEMVERSEKAFYETDPEKVEKDIVVNLLARPCTMMKAEGNTTIRLREGDRIQGSYYVEQVKKFRVEGLQRACNMQKWHLEELEEKRQKREGVLMYEWEKEVKKNIDTTVKAEPLERRTIGRRSLRRKDG